VPSAGMRGPKNWKTFGLRGCLHASESAYESPYDSGPDLYGNRIGSQLFLSARKADLKKSFQHLVLLLLVVVVGTRFKKRF
jgi:hypothetical protein